MLRRTPLYDQHLARGAKMVDFAGWDMPLHYGSQVREHHAVRRNCGAFDVSHMGVVDIGGPGATPFLSHLLANDVARLGPSTDGKALYGVMLNEQGGVVDDLITYRTGPDTYRLVINAGTRNKDLAWIQARAATHAVTIRERTDLAMVAIQGPRARELVPLALPPVLANQVCGLGSFRSMYNGDMFVARTGYTGENGYEVILPQSDVVRFWETLMSVGVVPVGLGARDTLRLEAGLNLYGSDMNDTTNPLETGLSWTIAWEPAQRDFMGRTALAPLWGKPPPFKRVGLILEGPGVLRDHQAVVRDGQRVGEVTSGSYSPTLGAGIALARVAQDIREGDTCQVEMRGRTQPARVVRPPFVRAGKPVHDD
ncbi:MAG: glycine cleavage system aminomethyltransferase GcvT [Magnetococcales bacterium]|nr:glycine cleavage system aminomethyltransferase GcvT [Magnetococcales bacterium]